MVVAEVLLQSRCGDTVNMFFPVCSLVNQFSSAFILRRDGSLGNEWPVLVVLS